MFVSKKSKLIFFVTAIGLLCPFVSFAGNTGVPAILGIRFEFILFALILIGVAVFKNHTFGVAVIGLTVLLLFKFVFDPSFHFLQHFFGSTPLYDQLISKSMRQGEWSLLLNLFGLLLGFAILAKHFEETNIPRLIPKYLPKGWLGPALLLLFVCIISSFLDNIAAALIGGTIALVIYNNKVHVGMLAAIVAASNAGGAGSVIGDTTTTMMWIDGVNPFNVLHAFIASGVAMLIICWFAGHQQQKYHPVIKPLHRHIKIMWKRLLIVLLILAGAITTNIIVDLPALGVWVAILAGSVFVKTPWKEAANAVRGGIFLICLVTCASLMPVSELPSASWFSAFILGFVSAFFDNIPLTKLCLDQGCYDWGMLAYAVGFGGSMVWFGSSAGVAICNEFPQARNVGLWIKKGWHVPLAYIVGFFVLYLTLGWNPSDNKKIKIKDCPCINCPDKTATNPNTFRLERN